jgi:outer membrane biosynthesis protein TonB
MRLLVSAVTATLFFATPAVQAEDYAEPQDALWQMQSCKNPALSYPVKRQRLSGSIEALFDITVDGDVENIRITGGEHDASMVDYVSRALSRWRYFGYVKDGELAPRKDVPITFTYGTEKSRSCTHTSLPELPSTLGDPADPYQSLIQCQELIMPKKAARSRTSGHVRFGYDIGADGVVGNITVQVSKPEGRFDADAQNMLDSWKYEEFIETGVPMARPGMVVDFYYGELPEGANSDRCTFAPWDATQQVMRRRMIQ